VGGGGGVVGVFGGGGGGCGGWGRAGGGGGGGGGSQVVISWFTRLTSVGKSKKHVRRNSGCVLISVWDITERYFRVVGFVSS